MKRLCLGLFFLAAVARGQVTLHTYPTSADTYPLDGNAANGLSNVVGPWCSGTTPAAGDILYWSTASGGCWADLPVGTNGQILTVTSLLPAWAAAAGGSAFSAITSGTNTAAAMLVGTGASLGFSGSGTITASAVAFSGITVGTNTSATMTCGTGCAITTSGSGTNTATATTNNAVTNVMLAQGPANSVVGVTGNAPANRGDIAPTTTAPLMLPKTLSFDGTNTIWQTAPYDLTKWDIINTSFWQRTGTVTPAVINSFTILGTGTSAGAVLAPALAATANNTSFIEMTTGTTTSGDAVLSTIASSGTGNIILTGNEVIDWLIYVPVASGATNTFRVSAGFNDTNAALFANSVFVTWDNNTDTHWAVETCKASTCTGPTASTTVATAAAWHHIQIVVNSNATSIAFYVDGTQLSSSPLTTNIPTVATLAPWVTIKASAGCASATTCVMDVNTIHYQKPVSR